MGEIVRVEGLRELRAGLKRVDQEAGRMLGQDLAAAVDEDILAEIHARTPNRSGRLAGSTRVLPHGPGVYVENSQPYANAIHWGRNMWPNQESERAVPSRVQGTQFAWGPLMAHREQLTEALGRVLDKALERVLPH